MAASGEKSSHTTCGKTVVKRVAIGLIHTYRYLASPWVGNQCRFYPTCSHYAEEAILHHGVAKGCFLTARRLLKCHPWHPGGIDFVPGTEPDDPKPTHKPTLTNGSK